ncbi:ISAs1 family transposase [Aetokthonos hydrillicola Thurmond2011]|jgi:predicted transposase YbfD/YdcC|uniref:ISAs1 family transposase n=1 Tax=Aetokthonos hydrillicola Thurmond2011 TaxID=2712845 RepID=A0AAP5I1W1_9CYAN|nr:ISAs1 family transposase [Aetokthonos hydrillicola]MBO3462597.1 ISAs1 family transposase [Aetokthonos hydrillicola CCALA 1050]MBW4589589.1 ISAs1 family transposase [Aetokthonos hydrillicola CCALA 1050]MDR9893191.1 ISAs1 family transposase [Aetokthonos hydrillicola Thurmond2011]
MKLKPRITISEHFSNIDDPRIERRKLHKLIDILTISLCAIICGADTWEDIELFGESKHEWLKNFLELPNGIPSHDTFARVFARLDPEQFQKSFINWIQSVSKLTNQEIVAIDGKTLRGSYDTSNNKAAINMVSAWATANSLVLGQVKVDDQSNEITAIPKLLKVLCLQGCIVTIDAIGCQKEIVKQIVEQGGDYVITLKKNQPSLYGQVESLFESVIKQDFQGIEYSDFRKDESGHGRHEIRQCVMLSNIQELIDPDGEWLKLTSVVMINSWRTENGTTTFETRYSITSLPNNAEFLAQCVRTHWNIENKLHWILDVQFDEDDSRVRKGNAPQNLAIIRHIALNLLNKEKTVKAGVKRKRNKAGWDNEYLEQILSGVFSL